MFRRKTDQVYSTLQQVQRRITEQSGVSAGESFLDVPKPRPAVEHRPIVSIEPGVRAASFPRVDAEAAAAERPAALAGAVGQPKRYALQVSLDLLLMLMVMWLATVAAAYSIGRYQSTRTPAAAEADFADGPAGNRDPATDSSAAALGNQVHVGNDYLVLQSVTTFSAEDEKSFAMTAKKFNDLAAVEKYAKKGFKPLFGVRKPSSGGLQLIYGLVSSRVGIERDKYEFVAEELAKNFKELKWLKSTDGK